MSLNEERPNTTPITVADLGLSNLSSVVHALRRVGAEARVTTDAAEIARARAVVVPGVGSFADGMSALIERDLAGPIQDRAAAGVPVLGICLGMQLLAREGEEGGGRAGLGLVPGRVVRMTSGDPVHRVPNIGWCDVRAEGAGDPVAADGCFYFAHGYEFVADEEADVAARHDLGRPVVSAVRRGSVRGVQFHPEKSQDDGLAVLDDFRRLAAAA